MTQNIKHTRKAKWLLSCFVAFSLLLFSCNNQQKGTASSATETSYDTIPLNYAKGFQLLKTKDGHKLVIYNPQNISEKLAEFELVQKKTKPNQIEVPCKRILCLSSTQLAYLFELECIDPIVGINSSRFLYHKELNLRVKEGKVKKVGKEGNFNTELIAALNPDVIFVSPFKAGGYDAIRSLGFQLVPMAAYNEASPLARAEWIKMMASFTGQEQKADSIFNNIENAYNALKALTQGIEKKPSVFSGKMKSGIWYVHGGRSFISHYFKDAGADYIIKDDEVGAYPMDFESFYKKAAHAKYWRLLTSSPKGFDKEMMKAEDRRYADFDAFKNNSILVCNIRESAYYEQNPVRPHVILADYIHHFHPSLLPAHNPVYYKQIH